MTRHDNIFLSAQILAKHGLSQPRLGQRLMTSSAFHASVLRSQIQPHTEEVASARQSGGKMSFIWRSREFVMFHFFRRLALALFLAFSSVLKDSPPFPHRSTGWPSNL